MVICVSKSSHPNHEQVVAQPLKQPGTSGRTGRAQRSPADIQHPPRTDLRGFIKDAAPGAFVPLQKFIFHFTAVALLDKTAMCTNNVQEAPLQYARCNAVN